jgi:hypothetical protein
MKKKIPNVCANAIPQNTQHAQHQTSQKCNRTLLHLHLSHLADALIQSDLQIGWLMHGSL